MGQSESRDREFFIDIIKHTLKKKCIKVNTSQLTDFLQFVQTVSPWFPERGSLDVDTWEKVGLDIKNWFTEKGGKDMPLIAFAIWNVLKETLADDKKALGAQKEPDPSLNEQTPLLQSCSGSKKNSYASTEKSEKSSSGESSVDSEEEISTSEEESDSEKKITKYYKNKWPTLQHLNISHSTRSPGRHKKNSKGPVGFAAAALQAQRQGEPLGCFPVIMQNDGDGENPVWEPLPFKLIKEIKQATSTYGPTSPYTLTLVESLTSQWMTPYDWFQVAKACLGGGNFLLWKAEYEDAVRNELAQTPQTSGRRRRETLTYDMLMGLGEWLETSAQLRMTKQALTKVTAAAMRAWKCLPAGSANTQGLANIKQKPEEPFEEFVARLTEAVERMVLSSEAKDIVLKQLAFENATPTCQSLLKTIKKSGNISDFIKACSEVTPSYLQGVAIAAALQGQTTTQFLNNQKKEKFDQTGFIRKCYLCGSPGHLWRQCPSKAGEATNFNAYDPSQSGDTNMPRSLCPRCLKGYHLQKDCRSRFHKNGNPLFDTTRMPNNMGTLSNQGNWVRGLPQAHQTMGAIQQPQITNPFVNGEISNSCSGQPQAVQDWTSVPPLQQY